MAIKVKQKDGKYKYKCSWCDKVFPSAVEADAHRDQDHELVYVQMLRSDVSRLLQFIFTHNDRLITDTMLKSLRNYVGDITKI